MQLLLPWATVICLWLIRSLVQLLSIAWIGTKTLDLGVISRGMELKLPPPIWLKSQGAVMSIHNEFQSQPCMTIHYTYNETLEGSSCCEMLESIQTCLILVWKVGVDLATFVPTHDSKTVCGDHIRQSIPFSTLPNHSLYLWWDIERVKLLSIAWISTKTLDLGVISRGVELKLSPPIWLKSQGAVMSIHNEFQSQPCLTLMILMMRHWKGQAVVNCLNWYKHTWSWCEK